MQRRNEGSELRINIISLFSWMTYQSHEIVSKDEVRVEAESPSGRVIKMTGDGYYNAQFAPDEIGINYYIALNSAPFSFL